MKTLNKYVGLDVHRDTTVIAVAGDGGSGEQRVYGTISSDLQALDGGPPSGEGAALSYAKGELNGLMLCGQ